MSPDVRREYNKQRADGCNAKQALLIARGQCKRRASPFFNVGDGDTVEYRGRIFQCKLEYDDSGSAPWECCTPLGEVKDTQRYGELPGPGWAWLRSNGAHRFAYNRKQALAEVRSWGPSYAHRADGLVASEIQRFVSWLDNQWYYVLITVKHQRHGKTFREYLGGVESDCTEYIAEACEELADEIFHSIDAATYPVTECGV